MILVTGDTHGELMPFLQRIRPFSPGAGDTVLVLGDFGFVWDSPPKRAALAELDRLPYTVAFIDGNHEDFPLLNTYPVRQWHGGKVHRISDNILHLMRGQCYSLNRLRFFTMGGAYSADRALRSEGVSWWREELPDAADYAAALSALHFCDFRTDFILTHTLPQSALRQLGRRPDPHEAELNAFLEQLYRRAEFRMWYAGHFHINERLCDDLTVLFDAVRVIAD